MELNFYTLSVIYLVYSFLGWVGETVVATAKGRRFTNAVWLPARSASSTAQRAFCWPWVWPTCATTGSRCSRAVF